MALNQSDLDKKNSNGQRSAWQKSYNVLYKEEDGEEKIEYSDEDNDDADDDFTEDQNSNDWI